MHELIRQQHQLLELNQNPLNREAKRFLDQLDLEFDPSVQPLYQLLLWGLNEGGLSFRVKSWAADYLPVLEDLAYQPNQEAAYRYLTVNPALEDEEEDALLQAGDLARRSSPLAAAAKLLDVFQNALTVDQNLVPSFPPNTPQE